MADQENQVLVELHDLPIAVDKNARYGRVVTTRSLTEEDLVQIAVARRSDLNPNTLRAAFEILREVAETEIVNGASVSFGLGFFRMGVNGVFTGDDAHWNPDEHQLSLQVAPHSRLRQLMEHTQVKIRGKASVGTTINTLTDVSSRVVNHRLTPGGMVNLSGVRMKIAGPSPDNGLYLTHLGTGDSTFIPATALAVNLPRSITFTVPADLVSGDYQLSITTQYVNSNTTLKSSRTFFFKPFLEII